LRDAGPEAGAGRKVSRRCNRPDAALSLELLSRRELRDGVASVPADGDPAGMPAATVEDATGPIEGMQPGARVAER
jgi:hypothetical protein